MTVNPEATIKKSPKGIYVRRQSTHFLAICIKTTTLGSKQTAVICGGNSNLYILNKLPGPNTNHYWVPVSKN